MARGKGSIVELTNHRLTSAARDVIKRAQQIAATRQHAELCPEHLLLALVGDRQTTAAQSLRAQGIEPESVIAALEAAWTPEMRAAPDQAVAPGEDAKLVVHFASKEAFQLGRREIDTLHLLLGIFYLQRGTALRVLREAGANLVGLREYVLVKSSAAPTLLSKEDKLWELLRPSPIFLALLAITIGSGAALYAAGAGAVKALTILFVVSAWIVSVCLHEFGHALTAFIGGDRSVREKGYLTLNPLKYSHPVLSIGLPLLFLFLGGIGLPGGAVYIDRGALRRGRWPALVAAAGPLATAICAVLLALPFSILPREWMLTHGKPLWDALAFLVYLEVTAVIFNLLPIPGLDGFAIFEPSIPHTWRQQVTRLGFFPIYLLYFAIWWIPSLLGAFQSFTISAANALNVPTLFIYDGMQQFIILLFRIGPGQ
jgi:Zn-dependent protease